MVLTGSTGVKAVFLVLGLRGFFLNFLVYVARVPSFVWILFLCIGVRVAGVSVYRCYVIMQACLKYGWCCLLLFMSVLISSIV